MQYYCYNVTVDNIMNIDVSTLSLYKTDILTCDDWNIEAEWKQAVYHYIKALNNKKLSTM